MVYNIAIVEDEIEAQNLLKNFIVCHSANQKHTFNIKVYKDGYAFLQEKGTFDLLFLDIQMPGMNGIELAKKVRETDENVIIVFVTNMMNYAVLGYSVNAYDFIVKPINKGSFEMKFDRIVYQLEKSNNDEFLTLNSKTFTKRVKVLEIMYVEVVNHDLTFHMQSGEEILLRGSLSDIEKGLSSTYFARCNNCYLVNFKYVLEISGDNLKIGNNYLKISRTKKKEFLSSFAKYLGGGA